MAKSIVTLSLRRSKPREAWMESCSPQSFPRGSLIPNGLILGRVDGCWGVLAVVFLSQLDSDTATLLLVITFSVFAHFPGVGCSCHSMEISDTFKVYTPSALDTPDGVLVIGSGYWYQSPSCNQPSSLREEILCGFHLCDWPFPLSLLLFPQLYLGILKVSTSKRSCKD